MFCSGKAATFVEGHTAVVVCDGHEMRRGRHYATFSPRGEHAQTRGGVNIGVVGPGFDPNTTSDWGSAHESPHGWVLYTSDGELWHDDCGVQWEGRPEGETKLKEGDVVVRLPQSALILTLSLTLCACCGAGNAARLRRGNPDGVCQRRAQGRHGPARHDLRLARSRSGPSDATAGRAAALGDGHVRRHLSGHNRPLARSHLSADVRADVNESYIQGT